MRTANIARINKALKPIHKYGFYELFIAIFIAILFLHALRVVADDASAFSSQEKKWRDQSMLKDPQRIKYLIGLLDYDNKVRFDETGGCYELRGEGITQIIEIDKNGIVVRVTANIDSPKSRCFKKLYLGRKVPPPPYGPIYDKMEMGYQNSK